ncbi:MAG: hypothetical protein OXE78_10225 [Gammaproteobacteria bacterium]|nr:hypothetical protein [Gammaproteobacteria bacterium]MCY4358285.1 hypothetical protein [Gammaproteobacteria bacterium]
MLGILAESVDDVLDTFEPKVPGVAEQHLQFQECFTCLILDLCPQAHDRELNRKHKKCWLLPDFAAFQGEAQK